MQNYDRRLTNRIQVLINRIIYQGKLDLLPEFRTGQHKKN